MTQTAERINVKSLVVEEPVRRITPEILSGAYRLEATLRVEQLGSAQDPEFGSSLLRLITLAPEIKQNWAHGSNLFQLRAASSNLAGLCALRLVSQARFKELTKDIDNKDLKELLEASLKKAQKGDFTQMAYFKIAFPQALAQADPALRPISRDNWQKLFLDRTQQATNMKIIYPDFNRRELVVDGELERLKEMAENAKEEGSWIVALDYDFQLYILSADKIVVDDTGIHALYEPKEALEPKSHQLPEVRRF